MGDKWQTDQQWLGYAGLVDLARHEEERLGVGYGLIDQWYYRGVDQVYASKRSECVGRVALYSCYCSQVSLIGSALLVGLYNEQ